MSRAKSNQKPKEALMYLNLKKKKPVVQMNWTGGYATAKLPQNQRTFEGLDELPAKRPLSKIPRDSNGVVEVEVGTAWVNNVNDYEAVFVRGVYPDQVCYVPRNKTNVARRIVSKADFLANFTLWDLFRR